MGQDSDQERRRESAVFRTGRHDPKVVSLQDARSRKQQRDRKSKSGEFLHGRFQLAPTSSDIPARVEGKRHEPEAVLDELIDTEIFVLLEDGPSAAAPTAKVVTRNGGKYVLVFEQRDMITMLAGEFGKGSPIQGRKLLPLLRGREVGIAVNLGHDSAALISVEAFEAYCTKIDPEPETLEPALQPDETEPENSEPIPQPVDAEPAGLAEEEFEASDPNSFDEVPEPAPSNLAIFKALLAPVGFPDGLRVALQARLGAASLCNQALLIRAEYQDGTSGFIILFSGVLTEKHNSVEEMVTAAMQDSGREDVSLDISFLDANDPMLTRMSRVAHHLITI